MNLFGGVIPVTGIAFFAFSIMAIMAVGYAFGRITVKGISLGTAGVFIIALLFGALFYGNLEENLLIGDSSYVSQGLKIVENLGLVFFVTAVGFIAGPKFFKNLKQNYKSYILLGAIIIISGGLACVACYYFGITFTNEEDPQQFMAILDGLLAGALTSTPAFSSAKATVVNMYAESAPELATLYEDAVTVGYGIAYLFGVIGVVLFVQLIPKITKADIEAERQKLISAGVQTKKTDDKKLIELDDGGFCAFVLAAMIGIIIGSIKIPLSSQGLDGTCFSLTTTGGTLITALVFGHFNKIGKISIMPPKKTLECLRELGLALFLIGAGVAGGARFIEFFKPVYFIYGMVMTIVPMIIGFLFAKYVLKLSLFNNLGSITGGMTSTPALGTLIHVAKTDEVASAYAATYPISLLAVVLVSQFLLVIWG